MIKFKNVSFKYKTGTHALANINLEINDGEFVYITGTTGSGKSTLIKLLDTEIVPTRGTLLVSDINVGKLRYSKVPYYRRKIGVVFQNFELLPLKTVFENVAYALEVIDTPKKKLRARVRQVLKLVDLTDKHAALPEHISGGQAQRVAIARAIANKPKILIADEPTGNLDPETSDGIISLFEKINKEEGTTVLVVTHDAIVVKNHPHRTIKLDHGHIVEDKFGASIDDIAKAELEYTEQLKLKELQDIKIAEEKRAKKLGEDFDV